MSRSSTRADATGTSEPRDVGPPRDEPLADLAALAITLVGGSACFRALDGRVLGSAGLLDPAAYDLDAAAVDAPTAIPDVAAEGPFAGHALVIGPPFVRAWARLPVPGPNEEPIAWLDLADVVPRFVPEERRLALRTVARLAAERIAAPPWKAALQHVPTPIFVLDVNGPVVRLVDGNVAARRMSSPATIAGFGESVDALFPWAPAHHVADRCLRVHATGEPEAFQLAVGDGPRVVYGVHVFPLPEGQLGVTVEDVTERAEARRRTDEFMTVVSHELRTPLAAIRGAVGLLEGGVAGPLPDGAARLVGIAREGTERLGRMIGDLLDLERLRAGLLPLRSEPLGVAGLVAMAVGAMGGAARAAAVTIDTVVDRDGTVLGDRERLAQALTNLLSNAVKFSPSGGTVRVRVSRPQPVVARVEVRDEGRGLLPEDAARIFAPFPSAEAADARVRGSVGLGLAISRFVVEGHGGTVGVVCGGDGATFWVELPVLTDAR